jgi:phosphoribosylamine--glycine ligase
MVEGDAINLLEFNVRLGDPEAQALLFGMSSDLYPICLSVAKKRSLSTISNVSFDMTPTAVIVMASQGYPESPKHPDLIEGTDAMPSGTQVFFAGVKKDDQGRLVTAGGRVLTCVASGETLALALKNCYEGVQQISFHGAQFRKDIGLSAL